MIATREGSEHLAAVEVGGDVLPGSDGREGGTDDAGGGSAAQEQWEKRRWAATQLKLAAMKPLSQLRSLSETTLQPCYPCEERYWWNQCLVLTAECKDVLNVA